MVRLLFRIQNLFIWLRPTLNLSGSGQQGAPSGIITNFSVQVVNSAIYMAIKLHKVILYSEYI